MNQKTPLHALAALCGLLFAATFLLGAGAARAQDALASIDSGIKKRDSIALASLRDIANAPVPDGLSKAALHDHYVKKMMPPIS